MHSELADMAKTIFTEAVVNHGDKMSREQIRVAAMDSFEIAKIFGDVAADFGVYLYS
jgi:hypothetical protein